MASQDWFEKDFYQVLGVDKSVTPPDLKKAYRKLARKYHPDSNAGDPKAEGRFKEISEAYSVLSDEEQRREYDQIRAMGSGARFTAAGPGQGGFEDVFGSMFGGAARGRSRGGFEDLLGGMFGQAGTAGNGGGFGRTSGGFRGFGGPTPGRDVTAAVTIDFTTATQGDTLTLSGGGGKPIAVRIPPGVVDGQKLKLKGKGEPSPDGGEAGDLVLTVNVSKHPVFERDGLNLKVNVPVTFAEAALGATVDVPTPEGPVSLKVPAGSEDGKLLRIRGRGAPKLSGGGKGDVLARLRISVPKKLSKAERDALEALQKASHENPRERLFS
jgi:molecular chaperone DnaJ